MAANLEQGLEPECCCAACHAGEGTICCTRLYQVLLATTSSM